MQVDAEVVRRKMNALTDDELRRIVTVEKANYTDEALAIAQEEFTRRGLSEQAPSPRPRTLDSSFSSPPKSTLSDGLVALVGVQLAAALVLLIAFAVQRSLISKGLTAEPSFETVNTIIEMSDRVRLLAFLLSLLVFCFWLHRMYRNLQRFGVESLRFLPREAVTTFFIPIMNVVQGFQVMQYLWQQSVSAPAQLEDVTLRRSPAPLVSWWWGALLLQGVISTLTHPSQNPSLEKWVYESYLSSLWLTSVAISGMLFIAVVRGITQGQRMQWARLARPAEPTRPDSVGSK